MNGLFDRCQWFANIGLAQLQLVIITLKDGLNVLTIDQTKNNNTNEIYSITRFVHPNKNQVPNKVKKKE